MAKIEHNVNPLFELSGSPVIHLYKKGWRRVKRSHTHGAEQNNKNRLLNPSQQGDLPFRTRKHILLCSILFKKRPDMTDFVHCPNYIPYTGLSYYLDRLPSPASRSDKHNFLTLTLTLNT